MRALVKWWIEGWRGTMELSPRDVLCDADVDAEALELSDG